jgi:N-acetylmuramoyl-L-alanine amidase
MKQIPSPNYNERDPLISLEYIVLHYTGMKDGPSALARLCDAAAQVSAHYIIEEDGSVIQLVDERNRAWHAGKSFWRGITDLNSASIGIEIVNPGHEFGYRPFTASQISALKPLLREIIARHNMAPLTCLLGHSDVAPSRKEDPGEFFPWKEFAQEGLGLWPQTDKSDLSPANEGEVASLLATIGYDTTEIADAILAFQRHYRVEKLTGQADAETVARLRTLKQSMS